MAIDPALFVVPVSNLLSEAFGERLRRYNLFKGLVLQNGEEE